MTGVRSLRPYGSSGEGDNSKKLLTDYQYLFNNWKKTQAYRHIFTMSDEERHSESEFYYPEVEEQAKTEQNNNWGKVSF